MKNIFKKFGRITMLAIAGVTMFSSCSRDFLNPDPLSFYAPENTLTSTAGQEALLATLDRHIKYIFSGDQDNFIPIMTEYLFSDVVVASKTDEAYMPCDIKSMLTPNGLVSEIDQARENAILYFWNYFYDGIMYANQVIDYCSEMEQTPTTKATLGRAKFHRAWRNYNLVFQWGNVPLVTSVVKGIKKDYQSTKRDAIIDFIVKDLEEAVVDVPSQKEMSTKGMINKEGVKVLLAKAYLADGQYQKAKALCDELLDKSTSGLELMYECFGTQEQLMNPSWKITPNVIWDLHRPVNKMIAANTECITGIVNQGSHSDGLVYFPLLKGNCPFFFNAYVKAPDGNQALNNYPRNNANWDANLGYWQTLGRGCGNFHTTYWFQKGLWKFDGVEDKGDLRHSSEVGNWVRMEDLKYNNVNTKASGWYGKNIMRNDPVTGEELCTDTLRRWYDWPHYIYYIKDEEREAQASADRYDGARNGSNGSWYLYRLAEVYLIRAEANLYLNNIDAAVADVNKLRERAHCDYMYTKENFNIGSIMDERARELFMEEWRNVELKRVSLCLAMTGIADEWGETYDVNTYDKQQGTDNNGGSYWYKRCTRTGGYYNNGKTFTAQATKSTGQFIIDKYNMYWPIPIGAINANADAELYQNLGYDGHNPNAPLFNTWEEAVEACAK